MCGFSGFFDKNATFLSNEGRSLLILEKMTDCLAHRGPDHTGTFLDNHCGLSHTRLSIIDVEGGDQPFCEGNFHFVYNGELYNTDALRRELMAKNITFRSHSDTEVVFRGLIAEGADFVKKLDGIFAFAFYNANDASLLLVRDYFGVKPLFYTYQNDTLVFSSEIKGLFLYPGVKRELGRDGLCELFGLGPARNPGNAIFEGIYEVKPGEMLLQKDGSQQKSFYFRLESKPHTDDLATTIDHTRFLLTDAIRRQMVSDVEICTFLSGGIDSSVVSSVCAGELQKCGKQLTTFSFDFADNDKYFPDNPFQPSMDTPYAHQMADYLGTNHHDLLCNSRIQFDYLEASMKAHDLPCMVDVDSSLLYFCSQVSKTHKVVLTGECADEIFGGYPWFHKEAFFLKGQFPWTPDLSPRLHVLKADVISSIHLEEYVSASCERAEKNVPAFAGDTEKEAHIRRISYLNIRYFMQTLLNRMDRTSMQNSLEARVPFCDKALLSYVFNVPWEMKMAGGNVKGLLRQASKGLLPDDVLFRKKSPYPKTYHPYYETLLKERMKEILTNRNEPIHALIDEKHVTDLVTHPGNTIKPWYGQLLAGPQMLAYLIQINAWLKHYHIYVL